MVLTFTHVQMWCVSERIYEISIREFNYFRSTLNMCLVYVSSNRNHSIYLYVQLRQMIWIRTQLVTPKLRWMDRILTIRWTVQLLMRWILSKTCEKNLLPPVQVRREYLEYLWRWCVRLNPPGSLRNLLCLHLHIYVTWLRYISCVFWIDRLISS